jgi:hypothetical protein
MGIAAPDRPGRDVEDTYQKSTLERAEDRTEGDGKHGGEISQSLSPNGGE